MEAGLSNTILKGITKAISQSNLISFVSAVSEKT
jgi:hypothetical protein